MKYLLMMHVPRGTGEYEIFSWPPEDFKAHMEHLDRINRELAEAGEWVDVQGLTPPGEARLVRAGRNGVPVTDGPFPEAKEFLAGYWIVDVDTPERAYEIAARASSAPGPGGAPLNMPIEVRQLMSGEDSHGGLSPKPRTAIEHLLREPAPQVPGAVVRRQGTAHDVSNLGCGRGIGDHVAAWPAGGRTACLQAPGRKKRVMQSNRG